MVLFRVSVWVSRCYVEIRHYSLRFVPFVSFCDDVSLQDIVVCLRKARILKPAETAVVRERLYKRARC
jgi:hypothetical protein